MKPLDKLLDFHRLYHPGKEDAVIDSCRVRLARNLERSPFVFKMEVAQRRELLSRTSEVLVAQLSGNYTLLTRDNTSEEERLFLEELNLVPEKFFDPDGSRGVILGDGGQSILLNEEDHIRIQALASGEALPKLYQLACQIDDILEKALGEVAFRDSFGYLTACPTNVGTGLRASLMLHLPALSITQQMLKLVNACRVLGFTIRGPHGEGSELSGNLYQLSNQRTLGLTEEGIIDGVSRIVQKMCAFEYDCRRQLLASRREVMLDKVHRTLGVIQTARLIGMAEAAALLSIMRLGFFWKMLTGKPELPITELMDNIKPAHLARVCQQELAGDKHERDRDVLRADYLRKSFSAVATASAN
jgi:protein arginine kinase